MEALNNFLVSGVGFLFGPIMLCVFLGTGILMTVMTRGVQFRKFGAAFREVFSNIRKKSSDGDGQIRPFQALATALSSCVGTGNIVGVTSAIIAGGPGAIFWMWISAVFGMATKYSEIVLAMHYREKDDKGIWRGGVMYILSRGMTKCKWLGKLLGGFFALCCIMVALVSCNAVQANSMVGVLGTSIPVVPNWVWGVIFAGLAGLVIFGGIKKIGSVCTALTPTMAVIYVTFGLVILVINAPAVPAALASIFTSAFSANAAFGGVVGITIKAALSKGIARGIFSNEAGVGGAPLVHVTSQIDVPAKQGLYGIVEVFFDTMIICTFTALIILTTGVGDMLSAGTLSAASAAAVANQAWINGLGGFGDIILTVCLVLFSFSTIIGWAWCGETSFEYLFGTKAIPVYRVLVIAFTFIGCVAASDVLWNAADFCNGSMCIPNLLSLILFCGIIAKDTKKFVDPVHKLKAAHK